MRAYTYDDVLALYKAWQDNKTKDNWCDLWMACEYRMRLLVFAKNKRLPRPIPNHDDLMEIVDDSVIAVMRILSDDGHKKPETAKEISNIFHYQNLCVFKKRNRSEEKYNRVAKTLNR